MGLGCGSGLGLGLGLGSGLGLEVLRVQSAIQHVVLLGARAVVEAQTVVGELRLGQPQQLGCLGLGLGSGIRLG